MRRGFVVLACLLAASACAAQQGAAQPAPLQRQQVDLPPFVEVDVCLPVSVLIQPNATRDSYSVALEGEPSALSYNVSGGVLRLETAGEFNTSRPVKVVVSLPARALQAINLQGTGAEVVVAPGFELRSFVASSSFGAGRLYVSQMMAQNATLSLSGTGDAVLLGSFGSVNVSSTGTGGVYVAGANDTVTLDLRGVSNAFVQAGRPSALVTGTSQGINVVQYTDGTCTVQSRFSFLQVCQAVPFITVPSAQAVWTCGLQVRGRFQCSNEGTAYTSSANGFVGASGGTGTTPVTTTTPLGTAAFTPSSFQFAGASPAGPRTGTQQQAGSVTPQGTAASSNIAGTGSVSATSVAGPGGAQTSTTQGGQTTGFQTTGQQTAQTSGGTGGVQQAGGSTSSSATASSSSTAFATASPASAVSTSVSGPGTQQASAQSTGGQASSGVIRVGADGASKATAVSSACQATPTELRMPVQGTA